ncbi:hypothetical protein P691DRAFT_837224 [Macrolepiota fuliginosa MF-IS2]|uniref:Uncharacterized protein n=1 Tax=Macrolepiota fuliginosa MF-IS2 TaxID=1400762 RepID=A0A9P5X680_9AGAR|nr:hypothetical protein P691DRAFT_837224 [Macrolepiota fuliginosa MF-IS2]
MSNSEQVLLWENLDLIGSTTVNGMLYGIALSLYVLSAQSLYPQLKDPHRRGHTIFMLSYASLVMILGIILLALGARGAQLSYIDHNASLGESRKYQSTFLLTRPGGIIEDASGVAIDILMLGIQIWRLWVIYSVIRYAIAVIILPVLLFLCFIGASEISKQYISIAAMLIESYTLQSAWSLATLILYFLNNEFPVGNFFVDCHDSIAIISYLLVIYRVSTGRGWNKQAQRQISRLRFHSEHGSDGTNSAALETAVLPTRAP